MRQKKELDNIQDKWILKGGGTEKKLFGWEEAPVMNRVIAGYTTTRTPEGMRSSE
jgi:hypothetical protein